VTEENAQKDETVEPPKKAAKAPKVMPHTARARAAVMAKIKAKRGS